MRLVDLLRSRTNAAETGAGSPGTGFLREQDVEALYTTDAAGGKEAAGGEHGGIARPRKSAPDEGASANVSFPVVEPEVRLEEWPDDPVGGPAAASEFHDADNVHGEVLTALERVYDEGERGEPISVDTLIEPLHHLIDVCRRTDTILRKAIRMKRGPISFPQHAVDTAITAIKTGIARGYDGDRLFSLALCALLGDIGMTRVNPEILEKTGKLTPGEFNEIKHHVSAAADIVSQTADHYSYLAPVIRQIHERENGGGYPEGLKGDNIHEFARIIGMGDVYTALTEPKVNREKYSGFIALQQIISRRGEDFNRGMIKSLIEAIGIFPLESLVKLNNGIIGRIIGISRVHPTRPPLSVLVDADGVRLRKPHLLDLEQEPLLYIEDPDIEEGAVLNA